VGFSTTGGRKPLSRPSTRRPARAALSLSRRLRFPVIRSAGSHTEGDRSGTSASPSPIAVAAAAPETRSPILMDVHCLLTGNAGRFDVDGDIDQRDVFSPAVRRASSRSGLDEAPQMTSACKTPGNSMRHGAVESLMRLGPSSVPMRQSRYPSKRFHFSREGDDAGGRQRVAGRPRRAPTAHRSREMAPAGA
jgi:hypothetical protein